MIGWDCQHDLESTEAALPENFYRGLLVEMFGPAGIGTTVGDQLPVGLLLLEPVAREEHGAEAAFGIEQVEVVAAGIADDKFG